jgi:drug/metabolite transporter (DMT)-like permease
VSPGAPASGAHVLRGVLAMFVCVAAFSFMDALLKVFAAHYPPLQVSAMRGAASLPFVVVPLLWAGRLAELRPRTPWLHLLRGLIGVLMLGTFVYALGKGSLAEVYAIQMFAPLLIVALAVLMLGERADAGSWGAVVAGLVGVLVVLRPQPGAMPLDAGLAAAACALFYALAAITVRKLARTDSSASMVFSFLLLVAIFCGVLSIGGWVPIRAEHWPWLAGVGLLGAIGQHTITIAFKHAPASAIAPIEYTALLWGLAIDAVFWRHFPTTAVLAGSAIIVGAGLYVVHRSRVAARS